jgi:ribose-phosphate pyrophosphokinase
MHAKLKIFYGNSNPILCERICEILGVAPGKALVGAFSDGEVRVEIQENVRGGDVFLLQSTCRPVNQYLMELLLLIDAVKRASAWRINSIIPYYGYGRKDAKEAPRVPISAKLVADLLTVAGTHRVVAVDLHANQIQGFFSIPVDNLFAAKILIGDLKERYPHNTVILAPDAGGVERARAFAKRLGADLAIIDQRHGALHKERTWRIVGDVKDRTVVIVDDMVDTGKTLFRAAVAAETSGATAVHAYCVHAILSGAAAKQLKDSPITSLTVSDSIPLPQDAAACEKIRVVSLAPILAEAIKCIHHEESVSSLFV